MVTALHPTLYLLIKAFLHASGHFGKGLQEIKMALYKYGKMPQFSHFSEGCGLEGFALIA